MRATAQAAPKPQSASKVIVVALPDVIIYSEATTLGPVTIGCGSVIGGNVWLLRDVPPGRRITQAQARQDLFESGDGI